MENLVWLIPLLACPLMMVAMMLMMGKHKGEAPSKAEPPEPSVSDLRAEKQRLDAEIARREGSERDAGDERAGVARQA